jgi:hypothetical protein
MFQKMCPIKQAVASVAMGANPFPKMGSSHPRQNYFMFILGSSTGKVHSYLFLVDHILVGKHRFDPIFCLVT